MFNYFITALKVLIKSKKIFNFPKSNKILIYDAIGAENIILLLKEIIDIKPHVMATRGEVINIPVLFFTLIKLKIKKKNYIFEYIKKIKPEIIITFIDNNLEFYKINNYFPEIKTIFIQNGWRSFHSDIFHKLSYTDYLNQNLKVSQMLVFGSGIGKHYAKKINGRYEVIGSIKNNFNKISNKKKKIVIYISQWMESEFKIDNRYFNNISYSYPCDKIVIPALIDFTEENNYKLYILTRSEYDSDFEKSEINYFRETFSKNINFFAKNKYKNSYEIIDTATIVTGIDSTLLYESISRGNKTGIFSFRGKLLKLKGFAYGWPSNNQDNGEFWTSLPDVNKIKKILHYLHSISFNDLKLAYKKNKTEDILYFDYNNTNAKMLIKEILN